MKKWLLILGATVIAVGLYFILFFPTTLSRTIMAHRGIAGAGRAFQHVRQWDAWWPKREGCTYQVKGVYYNEVRLELSCADKGRINGAIKLAPLNGDSVLVVWEGSGPGRWAAEVDTILGSFKAYVEDAKRLYGVDFIRTMSNDSTLVTMTSFTATYPSVGEVYARIDTLRGFAASHGAMAIDSPWLNVAKVEDGQFKWTVAIPVNKWIGKEGRVIPRRFVPYKNLEGEVHGGVYTAEKALEQMQLFKLDYNIQIMGLPYQCLMTDRRLEPDTTKWVTMICAPIS
jgi:hypothetical protein